MQGEETDELSREAALAWSEGTDRIGVSAVDTDPEQNADEDDDEPVLTTYRNNGILWAAFSQYADGVEEPSAIFGTRQEMMRDATRHFPVTIEYRPVALGCEASDEERDAVPVFAAAYDLLIQFGRARMA